jgi:predicted amidophosphoribosyltransferase
VVSNRTLEQKAMDRINELGLSAPLTRLVPDAPVPAARPVEQARTCQLCERPAAEKDSMCPQCRKELSRQPHAASPMRESQ